VTGARTGVANLPLGQVVSSAHPHRHHEPLDGLSQQKGGRTYASHLLSPTRRHPLELLQLP
jgi:hypothetical protein